VRSLTASLGQLGSREDCVPGLTILTFCLHWTHGSIDFSALVAKPADLNGKTSAKYIEDLLNSLPLRSWPWSAVRNYCSMFLSDSVGQGEPFATPLHLQSPRPAKVSQNGDVVPLSHSKIFVSMPSHAVVELPNMLICLSLATTYANTSLASISKEPHS
jgi:hypothetical protein